MDEALRQRALTLIAEIKSRTSDLESILNRSQPEKTSTETASPIRPQTPKIQLAWGKKVSPQFKDFVIQMAKDFNCPDPNWFMACMAFETMETFSPKIRPKRKDGSLVSSAIGLIQFLERTAKSLGTTTAELEKMTPEKQLQYVWLYFRKTMKEVGVKSIQSVEDCYMIIHWPAAVGKPLGSTMYVKGTSAYAANAGLDTDKDSIITKAEAGALVRAKLNRGLQPEFFG